MHVTIVAVIERNGHVPRRRDRIEQLLELLTAEEAGRFGFGGEMLVPKAMENYVDHALGP